MNTVRSDPNIQNSRLNGSDFLTFKNDNGVSKIIHQTGTYAEEEINFYKNILDENPVFIDVGANIGAMIFQLSKMMPNIRLVGFEPIKYYYDLALKNLSDIKNIDLFNFAAGNEIKLATAPVINTRGVGNYGSVNLSFNTGRTLPVPMIRLDRFLLDIGVKPRLIKIDVEGMEDQVLEGCAGLVDSEMVVAFEGDRRSAAMRAISMALSMFQNVYACRFESGKNVVSIMFFASNAHLNPRDFAIIEPVKKNTEYDLVMEKLNIIPRP